MPTLTHALFYKLDDSHTPIPVEDPVDWAKWMETHKGGRVVDRSEVGGFLVSTVFLGLDHDHTGRAGPILFETMVFRSDKSPNQFDTYQERYKTWEEAELGHAQAVEYVRNRL